MKYTTSNYFPQKHLLNQRSLNLCPVVSLHIAVGAQEGQEMRPLFSRLLFGN